MATNYQYQNDGIDIKDIHLTTPKEDSGGIESAGDLIRHLQEKEDITIIGSAFFFRLLDGSKEIPKEWAGKEVLLPETIQKIGSGYHVSSLIFGNNGEKPKVSGMDLSHQIFDIHCVAVIPKSS